MSIRKYNDPRWRRPCSNCGYGMPKPEVGRTVKCENCGSTERLNPWKDCPNSACDGELRAHHSFTSGGYKTGRLSCEKCGSTVNFAAKIETVITPDTEKDSRPPGVIQLMNELVGKSEAEEDGIPRFIRFTRHAD